MVKLMLPHQESHIGLYRLLVVEKEPGLYRLYVGRDGNRYCHYDTGSFHDLRHAVDAARSGFDPSAFELFPFAPYSREEVIGKAPHAFDSIGRPLERYGLE